MTFKTSTGKGVFLDLKGQKIAKYSLPIGEHHLRDGFVAVDVADQAALDAVVLDDVRTDEEKEREISGEILAIELKCLRPLLDGDAEYLNTLKAQRAVLMAKVRK